MALLAELDREQLPTLEPGAAVPASRRFAAVLAGALGRDRPGKAAP
jgi:hypothetical protein